MTSARGHVATGAQVLPHIAQWSQHMVTVAVHLFDFREFALIAVQQLVASEIGGEEEEDGAAEGEGEPGEDVRQEPD